MGEFMLNDKQKAIDGLLDLTQKYAKKHRLSYVFGCGQMGENQYFVGDIYHQEKDNDIFYICQALIQDASIGKAIAAAIVKYEKQFLQTYKNIEEVMRDH